MHSIRELGVDLYWVGANEHRLKLYENTHPIPRGISHNSYFLYDDKTVLFDLTDWTVFRQLIKNIEYLLDGRTLDYIVINHIEPGHVASLQEIMRRWPDVKVISTHKAFMIMSQFGLNIALSNAVEVEDGDKFCFGSHTVTFAAAPMVHWPEAMVTFDIHSGVLFTGAAFGSFGALDGKLFNDEIGFEVDCIDDARRYYASIIGKYGPHVRVLLDKVDEIIDRLRIICPLHGPVWRCDFQYILDKYRHWSAYEPEKNGVMIVYASMYGNTAEAVQALATRLCENGITNIAVYDVSNTHTSYLVSEAFKYSHIVVASVTYYLGIYPAMHRFLMEIANLNLQNRTFAIIENGSWACKAGEMMEEFINEKLKRMDIVDEKLSLASSLLPNRENELNLLVDSIIKSVNA